MADVEHRRTLLLAPAVLVGAYVGATIWLHARSHFLVTTFARFSDWTDYLAVTRSSVLSSGFWTGVKPAGYPLLIETFGEGSGVHWSAVVLSAVAWSALALSIAAWMRTRWLAITSLVLVLAFSLSERIQVWNDLAGSETLSLSLLVLALAAVLFLLDHRAARPRALRVAAWIVFGASVTWWCFARDSNAYVLVLAAVVAAVAAVLRRSAVLAVVCGCALLVSVGALVASEHGERWVVPYDNVVFNRVLPDRGLREAWRDAGMPVTPAVRSLEGVVAYGGDATLFHDPRLAAFRRWVRANGRSTYVENLVTKPSLGIVAPLRDLDVLLTSPVEVWGRIGGHSYGGSPIDPIVDSVFVPDAVGLAVWFAAVVVAAAWLVSRSVRSPRSGAVLLVVSVFGLAIAHLWLVWVGDAHNVARHAVTASVQLRLSGWIVVLLAVDEWLARRRARPAPAVAPLVPTDAIATA